jgi:hypothetical protein
MSVPKVARGSDVRGRADAAQDPHPVPGWWLHAALAGAALGLVATLVAGREVGLLSMLLGLVVVGAAVVRPGSAGPGFLLVCAVLAELVNGGPEITWRLVLQAPLLHAVQVLASLAAVVPAQARLEPAALGPSVRRYLLAQTVLVPVLGAAWLVPAATLPSWLLIAAGVGAVVLACLPVVLLRRTGMARSVSAE